MADFLSRLASGFGRGVEMLGTLGTADLFREREAEKNRQLGNILSMQSIPAFARPGGAEPDSPENIRNMQLQQLNQLGTPQALEILGKLSPINQSPEKMKALGMLSSVISRRYGLPAEQVNAMLMGGVEPSALGSLLKPEAQELLQTYDPATGQMVYTPKSQAAGKLASAPNKDRRIVEQGGIQYYADTGERVVPDNMLPTSQVPVIPNYLPQNVPNPIANFGDKDKAQLELLKQSEEKLKALEEPLAAEQDIVRRMDRFAELNKVQNTGASEYAPFYTNPALKEMDSIASEIAPRMRMPGSGGSSDKDVGMFKKATVSVTNSPQVNANIILARKAAAQNKSDQAEFFREYQSAYGHTKGAEKAWNEYLNANPIFDEKASAKDVKLNPNRLSYKDYFPLKNSGITPQDALAELKKRGK